MGYKNAESREHLLSAVVVNPWVALFRDENQLPGTNPLRERSLFSQIRKSLVPNRLAIPSPIRWQATGRDALRKIGHSRGVLKSSHFSV